MEERTGDNAMRLVIAEVPASTGWHGRVSELLAHVTSAADHLLLLVPPRLLADCRSLFDDMNDRPDVLPLRASGGTPADRSGDDTEAVRNWLGSRRPTRLAWLPPDAPFVPPDWDSLRTKTRCIAPWLPKYDLPRDRHLEQPLGGDIGWLATGDVLDVLDGQRFPLGVSFLSLADNIHRERLSIGIASARVADDVPDPPASAAACLHEGSRILAIVPHFHCETWLATALESLRSQTRQADAIVVIDDGSPHPPTDIVEQFAGCTLLVAERNHGPYRIIQQVIEDTDYDGYLFQDADDWSAHDRLDLLLRAAARTGAELVGCQEGRWQAGQSVACCLFPVDANRALAAAPVHALLHPTSLVSRALVMRSGGYATGLRFFGDAEFLCRSHPWGIVKNIPYVSYFRQSRTDSLTGSPGTGHHSPARLRIKSECKRRFWHARRALGRGELPQRVPYRTSAPVALRHVTGPRL
jgi:hypothetical protein